MFSRAVDRHVLSTKAQQPLQSHTPAVNVVKPSESAKRRFERTMSTTSSLGQLHEHAYFDENDFDDCVDLTYSPPSKQSASPQLPPDPVQYPKLPPLVPPKSSPVQWSSSPVSHFQTPRTFHLNRSSEEDVRPAKRRAMPWASSEQKENKTSSPPKPKRFNPADYLMDNIGDVKEEQKEFKKRNKAKLATVKPEGTSRSAVDTITGPFLSEEQNTVMKAVIEDGKSVFFTGSAGTGKSVLMRAIISKLKQRHRKEPDRLAITASTGLAACVIEGCTLHSWAGIGLGKEAAPELAKKIRRNAKTKTRWLRTKVLIVDEVSMVDGELFDKLEQIARIIRNNGRPFGGIQLVVTGDFFQLPPVPEKSGVAKFAFDAATWTTCIEHIILLTHVFRQKDPVFANMLNEMRLGTLTIASIRAFQRMCKPLDANDDIEATELFPTRAEVENANNSRMRNLDGETKTFLAVDSGVADLNVRQKNLANFMAPESLTLKKGAQVMLIKNIDNQLVNGSLGKVISFMDEHTFTVFQGDPDTFLLAQEPDGGSDDEAKAEARNKIRQMRMKSENERPAVYWPMVRFALPDGTSRTILCLPQEWKTENQNNEIIAKRSQVPLILAWALSIHKAQGQTLSKVKVDLGRVFEKGQAYVALSRATTQAGLQVLRFDPKKVMVHPRVTEFYSKLTGAESLLIKAPSSKVGISANSYEKRFVTDSDDDCAESYA